MFKEKGVVLQTAIADNIKCILALYENEDTTLRLLVKPVIRRRSKRTGKTTTETYKSWINARELAGLISCLQRALSLYEDYEQGLLDLEHVLAEDEDGRMLVGTESILNSTIDQAFTLPSDRAKEDTPL